MSLDPPLVPRHPDGVLRVIIPGRISTPGQDPNSIEASQSDNERWLNEEYPGPKRIHRLGEQASGWLVERASMDLANSLIVGGECDLLLMGELREGYRNPALSWGLAHRCVDHDTRFISRWDHVDTAQEDWETQMHVAVMRHGMAVPEVRRRVRRKATDTFKRGGMVTKVKYGYRKLTPDEAASGQFGPKDLRIAQAGGCEENFKEFKRRIHEGHNASMIVNWLIAEGIDPGPYVTSGRWSARVFDDLITDPILSGQREFRKSISKLVYGTGKHRAIPNPSPLQDELAPHLAYYTPEEHEELLQVFLAQKPKNKAAQKSGRDSPLWGRSRKLAVWPGQAVTCAACKGLFYQCGKEMKCSNVLPKGPRTCWNHLVVRTATLRQATLDAFLEAAGKRPGALDGVVRFAWDEYRRRKKVQDHGNAADTKELADIGRQTVNLIKFVKENPDLSDVAEELKKLKTRKTEVTARIAARATNSGTDDYQSEEEVRASLPRILEEMVPQSFELALLLRQWMPRCEIVPVQALDSKQVRPRMRLTIRLDAAGDEEVVVRDLFGAPPRILNAARCAAYLVAHPGASLRQMDAALGVNYMTVQRALVYDKKVQAAGIDDTYRELHEPPAEASRWRSYRPVTSQNQSDPTTNQQLEGESIRLNESNAVR